MGGYFPEGIYNGCEGTLKDYAEQNPYQRYFYGSYNGITPQEGVATNLGIYECVSEGCEEWSRRAR